MSENPERMIRLATAATMIGVDARSLRHWLEEDRKLTIPRRGRRSPLLPVAAADNNDAYNLSPGFILETVAAAKAFIIKRRFTVHRGGRRASGDRNARGCGSFG